MLRRELSEGVIERPIQANRCIVQSLTESGSTGSLEIGSFGIIEQGWTF
jgi:hypothetical protein